MLDKLATIVEEHCEEQLAARKNYEEKQAKLEAIRAKLLEDGIEPQEFLGGLGKYYPVKLVRSARPE